MTNSSSAPGFYSRSPIPYPGAKMPATRLAFGLSGGALARAPPLQRVCCALPLVQMAASPGAPRAAGAVFADERELWKQQPKKFQQGRYRDKLLERARDFLQVHSSAAAVAAAAEAGGSLLAEGFEFFAVAHDARVVALGADGFRERGTAAISEGGLEFYGFSVDPFEPTTVWFTAREPSGQVRLRLRVRRAPCVSVH